MKNKIDILTQQLNYYTKCYDEGHPIISDEEWDNLYFELQQLEQEYQYSNINSPIKTINYQVVNELKKVTHNHPMLSLDKTKDVKDIITFLSTNEFIAMSKMDGLTCSLTYKQGKLISAETRGNGVIGEDVLHNALHITNIPQRITNLNSITIDGEIICTYTDFIDFQDKYKNPRNFASGSIRLLDSKECSLRKLKFIAWDCVMGLEKQLSLDKKLLTLQQYGFDIVPFIIDKNTQLDNIQNIIKNIKEKSQLKAYPIDGIVFKYNDCKKYYSMGQTDHHFKGGFAYKFYDETYETTLQDIEWTMGRTGVLSPVAIVKPVEIEGTTVTRASLHNMTVLQNLLHGFGWKNQKVSIYKSNMIIPQILTAEEDDKSSKKYFNYPKVCPLCGEPTIIKKDNGSEFLYCNNPDCKGKLVNILDHFCSKKGLDIKGLSKATLEKLINWNYIQSYQDIFILNEHREQWIKKPGFGEKSVDKILNAIQTARVTTLDKIIAAAGIPEIGSRVAKDLAKHYNSWEDFRQETDFLQYDGIGEVMNNNLLQFDYNFLNLDYTVNLFLSLIAPKKDTSEKSLNKIFCITGKTHIWKNRAELTEHIEQHGGKVVTSMSSKVDYLINNDINSTSAKNKYAKEHDIPILTEEDYQSLS